MGNCGGKPDTMDHTLKPEKLPLPQEMEKPNSQQEHHLEPTTTQKLNSSASSSQRLTIEISSIEQQSAHVDKSDMLSTETEGINLNSTTVTQVAGDSPKIMFAPAANETSLKSSIDLKRRVYVYKKETKGVLKIERTQKFAAYCVPKPETTSPNTRPNISSRKAIPKIFAREPSRKIAYLRNTLTKLSMMDLLEEGPYESPLSPAPSVSPVKQSQNNSHLLHLSSCCDIQMCDVCDTCNVKGLSCQCGHFLCTECFCARVRDLCGEPAVLREHDFSIFCPISNCTADPWNSYHVRKLLDGPSLQMYIDALVAVCKSAGTLGGSGGMTGGSSSSAGGGSDSSGLSGTLQLNRSISLNTDRSVHNKHLQETADMLREQLKRLNVTPMEYIPLADIKQELGEIFEKVNSEQPYDEARMDFLLMCMENNPVYMAEKAELARQWREETAAFAQECLQTMRGYVPAHVFDATLPTLTQEDGLTLELAKRILAKKCLWLVRMRVVDIERVHEADLMGRFNPIAQNLDIVELAAIFAAVPEKFLNDPSGRKAQWRQNLENALREMDKQRQTNSLPPSRARNPAYKKQKVAPFVHRKTLKIVEAAQSSLSKE